MAEKELENKPKDLVEATPKETEKLESEEGPELIEKVDEKVENKKIDYRLKRLDEMEKREKEKLASWIPKTKLGLLVKAGKEKDIDNVLENGKKILEPEIVDLLLDIETDLILIGQAKGKFGGGKRRAWRQTQKKTKEGNVLTFSSMVVVGDKKNHIGLGFGKAKETLPAREKAIRKAKLSLMKIKRGFETPEPGSNDPHTVPFKVEGKAGSVKITLTPAPRGTGLAVADECKKILRLAGIKDVYGKTKGHTKTTFNLAKACVNALSKTTEMES